MIKTRCSAERFSFAPNVFPPPQSGGEEVQANTSPSEPAAPVPDEKEQPPVTSLAAASPHPSEDFPSDSNTKISFSNDPGAWDVTSQDFPAYWTEKGPQKYQNLDADFSLPKREYTNQNRYLTKSMFDYVMPSKQIGQQEWLIYLPSKKKVYCFYCYLFSDTKKWPMFCEGFSDWKNTAYITSHVMSEQHTLSVSSYHARKKVSGRIDTQMEN
ncbi:unnamed protein product [Caretta caretta]